MKVSVSILTGAFFYVEVANDAKVCHLKREIEARMEIPYDRLILLLDIGEDCGTCLVEETKDGATLAEVGIRDGSHIYLFFKPLDPPPFSYNRADNGGSSGY